MNCLLCAHGLMHGGQNDFMAPGGVFPKPSSIISDEKM